MCQLEEVGGIVFEVCFNVLLKLMNGKIWKVVRAHRAFTLGNIFFLHLPLRPGRGNSIWRTEISRRVLATRTILKYV